MKVVVSIPVHEKPDVIFDQIVNIQKYIPGCVVVLHVNIHYFEKYELTFIESLDDVWVNPVHLDVAWGNIVMTHVLNYKYMAEIMDFDYFLMHSSNDLYVREGVLEYMSKYDAGFMIRPVRRKYTHWWPSAPAWTDPWLTHIQANVGQSKIIASQVEGSFYKKEIMEIVVNSILDGEEGLSFEEKNKRCAREELFFSTVAEAIVPYEKIGRPVVFSEVHRFDRVLWKKQDAINRRYRLFFRHLITQRMHDRYHVRYNEKLFKSEFYATTTEVVDRIRGCDVEYIERNRYLDDGCGAFELYSPDGLFAVKRVKREYDDAVRAYIRAL